MKLLLEHRGRRYFAIALQAAALIEPPFSGAVFPCLLWDHEGGASPEQKSALAGSLIDGGCRYAVCGGRENGDWEEAFDLAYVHRHGDKSDEEQDRYFVMTTSHRDQPAGDVAFFFVFNTNFGEHDFREYLILHVGTPRAEEPVDVWVARHARGRRGAGAT